MSDFSIQIKGLTELAADARRAGSDMTGLLLQTMNKATLLVREEARRVEPGRFKNRTGNLRRSIDRTVVTAEKGVVSVGEKYGDYVEFGTNAHVIYPKRGKFLAFKSESGKMIFARRVNHPGSKPYPFMQPAAMKMTPVIVSEYKKVTDHIVKVLAGKQ